MQALTGVREIPDPFGGEPRKETCSSVILRLRNFGNLVPKQEHRSIFRKVMGKDQSLTVDDCLLNPD
jgi:hypothetical protein